MLMKYREVRKRVGSDETQKTTYVSLYGLEKSKLLLEETTFKAISIKNFGDKAGF